MRILKKAFLFLLIVNMIRIIPGCCECDDSSMPFNFTKMDIINLDNSGDWAVTTSLDTMKAGAVAFEIALFDSLGYYYAQELQVNTPGFSSAKAMSCDCSFPYQANQYLSSLSITTLNAITTEIPAGSDVSDLFVARPTNNSSSGNSLYITLEALCNQTNGKTYYDSGVESFGLFLTVPVAYSQAQFVISAIFSDNRELSDTTRPITIVNR
ncbi:MAG: DUF5034 domain-containing protein [Lentimicrobium sp.]|nr:DUF5034 domain-containing protein [Lentimicrobium sp.]